MGNVPSSMTPLIDTVSNITNYKALIPWGTYKAENTTLSLSESVRNYLFLFFKCGSFDASAPSGMSFNPIFTPLWVVGEGYVISYVFQTLSVALYVQLVDETHIKILKTTDTNRAMIRQVFGFSHV